MDERTGPVNAARAKILGLPKYHIEYALPRPGRHVEGVILSVGVLGLLTHWMGGQVGPHLREAHRCEGCQQYRGIRWEGYLAAWDVGRKQRLCVPVSKHAVLTCPALLSPGGLSLRGRPFRAIRDGKEYSSPVVWQLEAVRADEEGLPEEPDILAFLAYRWRVTDYGLFVLDDLGDDLDSKTRAR